jgi:Uma2 family endonuclease
VLIVKVLSASTHRDDVAVKVKRYVELPSVQEIWLIDSRERWAQIWRRNADAWIVTMPLRGDGFESGVLADRVALDRLYRNTGL